MFYRKNVFWSIFGVLLSLVGQFIKDVINLGGRLLSKIDDVGGKGVKIIYERLFDKKRHL